MIIKSNLASNPTRNYTLYFLGCLFLAVTAVAFTAYNLSSLISTYETNSGLRNRIAEQQKLRSDLQGQAAGLRSKIASIKTEEFVSETEFLNNAIKRRVFSWTALFDQFEAIFPNNVKMLSVIPSISGETINIRMEVSGKELKDIVDLIKVLQSSAVFSNVVFKSERQENESLQASITLEYTPDQAAGAKGESAPASTPAPEQGKKEL